MDSGQEKEEKPKTSIDVEKTDVASKQLKAHLSRSFYEMRPNRLSGASDASSLDSSHSSTASEESQLQPQQQQQQQKTRNDAIEILSSDEEEEDEKKNDTKDSDSQMPQFEQLMPSSYARELKTLEFTLKNQEVLYKSLLFLFKVYIANTFATQNRKWLSFFHLELKKPHPPSMLIKNSFFCLP